MELRIPTEDNKEISIVKAFSYKNENIDVGILPPDTYIINKTKNESIFMTSGMKYGVTRVKFDYDRDEVHIYGYVWGQTAQWERYSFDGCYLGFINDNDTYENIDFD